MPLTADELAAVARGQFVRPAAGVPAGADHYRLVGPDGALVAIASGSAGRLAPGQGVRRAGRGGPGRLTAAWRSSAGSRDSGRSWDRRSWSSACSTVSTSATCTCSAISSRRPRHARPAPTVITFDHHPDEVLTGHAPPLLLDPAERLERLAAAGVEVTVVQPFDAALRETPYDVFVERIRRRVELRGFLMTPDAAFGYERQGTPETPGRARPAATASTWWSWSRSRSTDGPVRSSEIRSAIAAGDLAEAAALLGRPGHADRGREAGRPARPSRGLRPADRAAARRGLRGPRWTARPSRCASTPALAYLLGRGPGARRVTVELSAPAATAAPRPPRSWFS